MRWVAKFCLPVMVCWRFRLDVQFITGQSPMQPRAITRSGSPLEARKWVALHLSSFHSLERAS